MRALMLVLALVLTVSACAAAPAGSSRNTSVLTREEIIEADRMTALDLVQSERPQWLNRRGSRSVSGETGIAVYLDGTRLGGTDALRDIPAINVERMRFYSEREAQFRWGVGHLHGAIEVISTKS